MSTTPPNERYLLAMAAIMRSGHWLTDRISATLKPLGLTEPQYNVLRLLIEARGEPLAQQDIQAGMLQPSSNVSRIVDRLLEKGLVTRSINPENRRKMDIALTEEGRRLEKKASKQVLAFHATIAGNLSDRELGQLTAALKKFRSSTD